MGVLFSYIPFVLHKLHWLITGNPFAKNIIWLFVAFYGHFTMVISDEGMDANRYNDNLLPSHHRKHPPKTLLICSIRKEAITLMQLNH
jgi:hypothetical protein